MKPTVNGTAVLAVLLACIVVGSVPVAASDAGPTAGHASDAGPTAGHASGPLPASEGTTVRSRAARSSHGGVEPAASGEVRWLGQELYFEGSGAGAVYELRGTRPADEGRRVGGLVTQFTLNETGEAVIETDGFDPDTYVIVTEGGDVVTTNDDGEQVETAAGTDFEAVEDAAFELARQTLEAEFDPERARDGESTLELDSNRAQYVVELTAEGLSNSDMQEVFGGTETEDGTRVRVPSDGELEADFGEVGNGEFIVEVAVLDTTASAEASIRVGMAGGSLASFAESGVTAVRGDVATVAVELENTDEARLVVDGEGGDYRTTVAFVDDDEDGSVTLGMNTFVAGGHTGADEDDAWSVGDGDRITEVTRETDDRSDPLGAGEYDLTLVVGERERDTGVLVVGQPSVDRVRTGTAPGAQFPNALEDVRITETERVATEDVIVADVRASGVFGLLAAQSGSSATTQFRELVGSDAASFTMVQEAGNANRDPIELDLGASVRNDAVRVRPDPANGRLVVLLDESRLRFDGPRNRAEVGDRFEVTFTLEEESGITARDRTATGSVRLVERRVAFVTDREGRVVVPARADATVSGTTTVAPGTNLTVTLRGSGESPFTRTGQATVTDDRTFAANFDLRGVATGTTFGASVRGIDATAEGVVRADATPMPTATPTEVPPATPTATPTPTPTPSPTPTPLPTPTPSPTPTPTPSPTPTPTPTPSPTPPPTTSPAPTTVDGPGFGPLAAFGALTALALLVVVRRRTD